MAIAISPSVDAPASRALELCGQVLDRLVIEDAVSGTHRPRTPSRTFRALMEIEVARLCSNAGIDRLEVINAAFWQLCPPERR